MIPMGVEMYSEEWLSHVVGDLGLEWVLTNDRYKTAILNLARAYSFGNNYDVAVLVTQLQLFDLPYQIKK